MCASPTPSPCLAHGVVHAPSCTAHLAPGPVRVHSCLPCQGLCKHGEALPQPCTKVVPWVPSDEAPPWNRAAPSQGSQLSLCPVAAPQAEDTHPPSSCCYRGEQEKTKQKQRRKRRANNFGVTHRRPCWVLCTARHLTQSKVTSLSAEPFFPALFCN